MSRNIAGIEVANGSRGINSQKKLLGADGFVDGGGDR